MPKESPVVSAKEADRSPQARSVVSHLTGQWLWNEDRRKVTLFKELFKQSAAGDRVQNSIISSHDAVTFRTFSDGSTNLTIPPHMTVNRIPELARAIDPQAPPLIRAGTDQRKAAVYLRQHLPAIAEGRPREIAEATVSELESNGRKLQGESAQESVDLTPEDITRFDSMIGMKTDGADEQQLQRAREKKLKHFFNAAHRGEREGRYSHSQVVVNKATQSSAGELMADNPFRGLLDTTALVGVQNHYTQIGKNGWTNEAIESMELTEEEQSKSLGELLDIPNVRARLDEVRALGDPKLSAAAERAALRHIQWYISGIPYGIGSNTPSEALESKHINCVEASNIGLAASQDLGIPLLGAFIPNHTLTVYPESDGTLRVMDFLHPKLNDVTVGDEDIRETIVDGKRYTAKEIAGLAKDPEAQGVTVNISPEKLKQFQPNFDTADQGPFMTLLPAKQGMLANMYDAVDADDETRRITPDNPQINANYIIDLGFMGKSNKALAIAEDSIQLYPTYGRLHRNKGTILESLGRPDEALDEYKKADELSPNDPENKYWLGKALSKKGDHADGAATLLHGLGQIASGSESNYTTNDYYNRLDYAFWRMGYHNEVDDALEAARQSAGYDQSSIDELQPEETKKLEAEVVKHVRARLSHTLGHEFWNQGRKDESVKLYEKAFTLQPESTEYGLDFAGSQYQARDFTGSGLTILKLLQSDDPQLSEERSELYDYLSKALSQAGGSDEDAQRAMTQAERLKQGHYQDYAGEQPLSGQDELQLQGALHSAFGDVLRDKEPEKAQQAYESALGLNPHHLETRFSLSDIYSAQEEYEKAATTMLDAGAQVDPKQQARVIDSLIGSFNGMKRPQGALVAAREAEAFDSQKYGPVVSELEKQLAAAEKTGDVSVDTVPDANSTESQKKAYLYTLAGYSLFGKNRDGESLPALTKAAALVPENSDYQWNAGLAQYNTGDLTGAKQSFMNTIDLVDPQNSEHQSILNNDLGDILSDLGNDKAAAGYYAKAIALNESDFEPRYNLVGVKSRMGDKAGAGSSLLDALSTADNEEDKTKALGDLAGLYSDMGRQDLAVQAHKAAAAADPDYPYEDRVMDMYVTAKNTDGLDLSSIRDKQAPDEKHFRQSGYAVFAEELAKTGRSQEAAIAKRKAEEFGIADRTDESEIASQTADESQVHIYDEAKKTQVSQKENAATAGQQNRQDKAVRTVYSWNILTIPDVNRQEIGPTYDTKDAGIDYSKRIVERGSGIVLGKSQGKTEDHPSAGYGSHTHKVADPKEQKHISFGKAGK